MCEKWVKFEEGQSIKWVDISKRWSNIRVEDVSVKISIL